MTSSSVAKKKKIAGALALATLACAACSNKGKVESASNAPPVAASAPSAPGAPAAEPPATLTDVNVAAADMGGAVEELTGNYGPGLTGRRLIDSLSDPTWMTPAQWSPTWMNSKDLWAKYPQEAVISFYERQPALVGAVAITFPEALTVKLDDETSTAPKGVEVWTSMDNKPEKFAKVAAATLEATPGEHAISFPATEARYVKLRVLSGASPRVLEIAELRVLEAARAGYVPLFTRAPGTQTWKGGSREAAQRGLDWLQQSAADWTKEHDCFGCHVQAQALLGQAIALEHDYRVSMPALRTLADFIRGKEAPAGTWAGGPEHPAVVFGAMGLTQATVALGKASEPGIFKAVDYLLAKQTQDGATPADYLEPPIIQGQFMTTANALVAIKWAAGHSQDPKYAKAAERAITWIADHDPETNQDKVFKVVALMHYGSAEQKRTAWSVVEELAGDQQPDGGWKETAATEGSNAFATGQTLYAFKQAGVSVRSPMFKHGVDYLLQGQVNKPTPDSGSWKAVHTQSQRKSDFAPTMWAVIGLAGAYGVDPTGALKIAKEGGGKAAPSNLEIVLDVSGSMKTKLGDSTRWDTAIAVLKEVVGTLPEELNVGLRVYGHRYSSKSAQTCSDTELLVPIEKLNRERILEAAAKLQPRGETPLIRSVLQTLGDLKAAGGGSVILITDGEESCQGDPKTAAAKIKASGLNVSLNIVGFTLTGKTVEAQLGALASSTGGRYYGAQDGAQLSRALKMAALQRLPYDILDSSGRMLVSGETSELSHELAPGAYRVRMNVLGQVLEEPVTIAPDQTTTLAVGIEGDRFVLRR